MISLKNERTIPRGFMLLMLAFFGSIVILSLIDLFTENTEDWFIAFALAAGLLLYGLAAHGLLRIRREGHFLALLISLSLGIRLVWILTADTVPQSDFALMYNAALRAAQGDFSFSADPYFVTWPYQMGFTLYQALVLRLTGSGILALKLMNCLVSAGTMLLVYKTGSRLLSEGAGRLAGFLFSVYPPAFMMDSVLSNQQLAVFLFYLGFYLLLRRERARWPVYLLVGLLFALGQVIRPLAAVVLTCFALYQLLRRLLTKEKGLLLNGALTLLTYFTAVTLISQLLIAGGLSPYGLKNRDPLWKFVTGSNYAETGQYSAADAAYVSQFPLGEEREQAELQLIRARTADPVVVGKLMLKKFARFWGGKDNLFWSVRPGRFLNYAELVEQSLYVLAMLAAFFGAF
ncbi:MAG: glycosyltransferase family 39 protein, partial [Oscillospiraceae bacterium]|nr:glycosyltransferase family 39 protein [Oscillospiraceae bacterium]